MAREVLHTDLRTPNAVLSDEQARTLQDFLRTKQHSEDGAGALYAARSFTLRDDVVIDFVHIPAGTFCMGSSPSEEGHNEDEVEHPVKIRRPFYLSRYPVTQQQYEVIVGDSPSYFHGKTLPVEMVSWFEALLFCELLTERLGKRIRLPTEAEWEYACRAGTATPFWTGCLIATDQANFDGRVGSASTQAGLTRRATSAVDSFPANPWGLHDMHGNIWEWCADWYGPYPEREVTDPVGPEHGSIRVLRGGSWFHGAEDARSAQRDGLDPGRRHSIYGFRVALNEMST
jgi:formylglycine-generating enzyme required for sulfatase activity